MKIKIRAHRDKLLGSLFADGIGTLNIPSSSDKIQEGSSKIAFSKIERVDPASNEKIKVAGNIQSVEQFFFFAGELQKDSCDYTGEVIVEDRPNTNLEPPPEEGSEESESE